MLNIEMLVLGVLAVTITVMSTSITDTLSSDTNHDALAATTPVTSSESVTHEATDIDVIDELGSRLGRTLPPASPQTPAKATPSAGVALAPHSRTEAKVQKLANTTVPQGDEVVKATLQEEVNRPNYQAVDTAGYQEEVDVSAIQGDGHRLAHEVNTAVPEEKVDSATFQEVTTITSGEVSEGARSSAAVTLGNSGRVPSRKGQLVKCFCGGQEVLTSGGCQKFQAGTFIDGERDHLRYITVRNYFI